MKLTIKDVAKRSGVSVATVSRILNGLEGYTEETKNRVLAVVEELGYQRNAIARGLVTKSTNTIGVLMPSILTLVYAEIIKAIEDVAHKNNYSVFLCNTGINGGRTLDYIRVLGERQVDGIIVASLTPKDEYYKAIMDLNKPTMLVSTMSYKYQIPYVKVDDKQAAYAATQYLIEKGHKKIAMIAGIEEDPIAGLPRINGYIEALKDYGIVVEEGLIKYGDFSYNSGKRAMEDLLEEKKDFTAVFAASDDMAVGALSSAYKKGIRVPEDMSIIGYDNTQIAEMSIPALTVVAQPLYNMGKRAAENLFNVIIHGEQVENIIMPHSIVERESVREI